jgi:hypothetical protein
VDAFSSPWLYLSDGTTLEAIDLTEDKTRWKRQTSAVPFEAVDTRRVAVDEVAARHVVVDDVMHRQLQELDGTGEIVLTSVASVRDPRIIVQGNGILHGVDPLTHSVIEVREPAYVESGWFSAFEVDESLSGVRQRLVALTNQRPSQR